MRQVTVRDYFHLPEYEKEGDIGIEIEMEGMGLCYPDSSLIGGAPSPYWFGKPDNSMKGHGLEYYFQRPLLREEVKPALKWLKDFWKTTKAKPMPTNQDAVHVHMNCRDLTLDQTMSYILLLVLLEDLLVRWCGDTREGNLFCLRSQDAEGFLTVLRGILIKKEFGSLSYESLKYANINIAPLGQFGSVEVRCMQTPKDIMQVGKWVEMLCCVYDAAIKLPNVRDVVDIMAFSFTDELLLQIFGDYAGELLVDDADHLLLAGRERVKEVVYSAHIYKERKKNKALLAPPAPKKKKVLTPITTEEGAASLGSNAAGYFSSTEAADAWVTQAFNDLSSPPTTPPPVQDLSTDEDNYLEMVQGTTVKKYLSSHTNYVYIYQLGTGNKFGSNQHLKKQTLFGMFGPKIFMSPPPQGTPDEGIPVPSE